MWSSEAGVRGHVLAGCKIVGSDRAHSCYGRVTVMVHFGQCLDTGTCHVAYFNWIKFIHWWSWWNIKGYYLYDSSFHLPGLATYTATSDSLSLSSWDATGPHKWLTETMTVAVEGMETDLKYSALIRQTDTGIMSGNLEPHNLIYDKPCPNELKL